MAEPTPRKLSSKANTADLCNSSPQTIDRWRKDPKIGFPEPVNINNKLFWFLDEVLEWIENRPRVSQKPTVLQHKRIEAPNEEAR
jgi:predicted DNA-binding transcriptional regulator AlpA